MSALVLALGVLVPGQPACGAHLPQLEVLRLSSWRFSVFVLLVVVAGGGHGVFNFRVSECMGVCKVQTHGLGPKPVARRRWRKSWEASF
jgi:hypothetical protein